MGEIIKKDLPAVAGLLQKVLGKSDYSDIRRLGGLTNHTYHVIFANGEEYVVRIPGEGTEEIIVRDDEKKSTQLACKLGVDAPMLYFGENGAKVSQYLKDAQTMSAETIKSATHIAQIAQIFRTMHDCGEDTGVPFEVFDMAAGYEKIIDNMNVPMFADYDRYKAKLMQIKEEIDSTLEIKIVPCHNDPLCENWVLSQGRMYLIDWEYAGMNDGMWDVADVSIEANFDDSEDLLLLEKYLGRVPTVLDKKHFLANKLYVDFLWTLWAKARVPYDGQPMEDWAVERYNRLKENVDKFVKIEEE
jgi:thiamine kinase-like enzyme